MVHDKVESPCEVYGVWFVHPPLLIERAIDSNHFFVKILSEGKRGRKKEKEEKEWKEGEKREGREGKSEY